MKHTIIISLAIILSTSIMSMSSCMSSEVYIKGELEELKIERADDEKRRQFYLERDRISNNCQGQ